MTYVQVCLVPQPSGVHHPAWVNAPKEPQPCPTCGVLMAVGVTKCNGKRRPS